MPDYSKGKIYKLWSPELPEDMIYIGSTVNTLCKRLCHHKNVLDTTSIKLFEASKNVKIELIENFACKDKNELNRREGEWIRKLKCVNRCIAGRTINEWRTDNKEKNKERDKQYYESNIITILEKKKEYHKQNKEKNKQYREDNKDKIKQYREDNKDKTKQLYEQNKDRIKEQRKEYYKQNTDKIKEQRKEYYKTNKERINQRNREYYAKKKLTITVPQNSA